MNYVKSTVEIAASVAAKKYLEELKILPSLKFSADFQLMQLS